MSLWASVRPGVRGGESRQEEDRPRPPPAQPSRTRCPFSQACGSSTGPGRPAPVPRLAAVLQTQVLTGVHWAQVLLGHSQLTATLAQGTDILAERLGVSKIHTVASTVLGVAAAQGTASRQRWGGAGSRWRRPQCTREGTREHRSSQGVPPEGPPQPGPCDRHHA